MNRFFLLVVLLGCVIIPSAHAAEKIKFITDPPQRLDVRFRLFKTENMWNFLELDTQTGRIWQVQFTVDKDVSRVKMPINDKSLVTEGKNGRFTLYPTDNMWNFLLVDQDVGLVWQVQFSVDDENRGLFPVFSPEDLDMLLDKAPKKSK